MKQVLLLLSLLMSFSSFAGEYELDSNILRSCAGTITFKETARRFHLDIKTKYCRTFIVKDDRGQSIKKYKLVKSHYGWSGSYTLSNEMEDTLRDASLKLVLRSNSGDHKDIIHLKKIKRGLYHLNQEVLSSCKGSIKLNKDNKIEAKTRYCRNLIIKNANGVALMKFKMHKNNTGWEGRYFLNKEMKKALKTEGFLKIVVRSNSGKHKDIVKLTSNRIVSPYALSNDKLISCAGSIKLTSRTRNQYFLKVNTQFCRTLIIKNIRGHLIDKYKLDKRNTGWGGRYLLTQEMKEALENGTLKIVVRSNSGNHKDIIKMTSQSSTDSSYDRYRVYCAYYNSFKAGKAEGYSLYRYSDRKDLGNAVFRSKQDCRAAARVANNFKAKVVCGKYSLRGNTGYSIYKIIDGKDLGNAIMRSFSDCQDAVRATGNAKTGILCSKYAKRNITGFSIYRILDGKDLGNAIFSNFSECNQGVKESLNDIFCAKYSKAGRSGYSKYSIKRNRDLGQSIYSSMDRCIDSIY